MADARLFGMCADSGDSAILGGSSGAAGSVLSATGLLLSDRADAGLCAVEQQPADAVRATGADAAMSLMKESYRRERIAKLQRMTVRDGCSPGMQKAAMNEIWSLLNERFEPDSSKPPFYVFQYLRSLQSNLQPNQLSAQSWSGALPAGIWPSPLADLLQMLGMAPARGSL